MDRSSKSAWRSMTAKHLAFDAPQTHGFLSTILNPETASPTIRVKGGKV